MSALEEYEEAVRKLTFGKTPNTLFDSRNDALYRRFVRGGVRRALRRALPIALNIEGDEVIHALVDRFLDERPPQTKLYRNLPLDFSAFVQDCDDVPLPLKELIHFECIELEVLFAEDPDQEVYARVPDENHAIYTHPSARLCVYHHAVDLLKKGATAHMPRAKTPRFVVVYRLGERFAHKRIAQKVAVLLSLSGTKNIGQSLDELGVDLGERRFLKSRLSELCSRGIIHGFYQPTSEN